MAVLIEIKNACKRYGDQVLLDGASATITDDGRVGFIGRNGAGKSTLLRVILGEEELDGGEVVRHPRRRPDAGPGARRPAGVTGAEGMGLEPTTPFGAPHFQCGR